MKLKATIEITYHIIDDKSNIKKEWEEFQANSILKTSNIFKNNTIYKIDVVDLSITE